LTAFLLAACAAYTPAPVDPVGQLSRFNQRRLTDPALARWLDQAGASQADSIWSARRLALAAEFFRPDRERWLSRVREGEAGLITAGARPQPGVTTDVEYAFSDPQGSSRWGLAVSGILTLELGGKRGARIARARAANLAARATVRDEEWQLVTGVYRAVLALGHARLRLDAARQERGVLDSLAGLARARYDQGTLGRLELARVEEEARSGAVMEVAAERSLTDARSALALALGLPAAEVPSVADGGPPQSGCALLDAAAYDTLQREALLSRWAVGKAAAEYLVAEGDLRSEVANASPNLQLGPGLFFDQGTGKLTLGLSLPAIPLNRNRGPIAEAEARRAARGARVAEAEEQVLGELDAAAASCRAARHTAVVADSLAATAAERNRLAQAAFARGEIGRYEVALATLDAVRAARQDLEARLDLETAGLALERALGAWGRKADGLWPSLESWASASTGGG
jgi:outer membrane protein TolC